MPSLRSPQARWRPPKRLGGNLAAGHATSNGGILWEIVEVAGAARCRVRIKVTGNGGAIDLVFVGPDFPPDQDTATAYASLVGTRYTTGNPTQVAVTAGTEAVIDIDVYGEGRLLVKYTGATGAGVISYCDVSQI